MRITRFESFLANARLHNWLFLCLPTDMGLTGVGEAPSNGRSDGDG